MYDASHRSLLRTLMTRGVLLLSEAEQLLREQTGKAPLVQDYVREINDKIRPFQQSIKLATDELTNDEALVFMSLGLDDFTKSQAVFSQAELQYFRLLLEQILTTDRRQVSAIAALNLVTTLKASLTKHDAEKLLNTWCAMRYLDSTDDCYGLGLRAVHEFEGYMRMNMPDMLEECSLCKQIVFRGCNCPACGLAVHTRCLNRYIENMQHWPCCKSAYSGLPEPADVTRRPDLTTTQDTFFESSSSHVTQLEASQLLDSEEAATQQMDEGLTQASQLGISQSSVVRKRKRQW